MIVLTDPDTSKSVSLDPDMGWRWVDEFGWNPVRQSLTRSIGGAAVVQTSVQVGGRPITLAAGESDKAWLTGADVAVLRTWAAVPGKILNLALRGKLYRVIWRHHDEPALDVAPVVDYDDWQNDDYFTATLKLMDME